MQTKQGGGTRSVKRFKIVWSKKLEEAFLAKQAEFKRRGIPSEEILAFHGTEQSNVDSILQSNLQYQQFRRAHGLAHGPGNYFSEFPQISFKYGQALILFRVLRGHEYEGSTLDIPLNFHSKKVGGNTEGFGKMLIIKDSDQFVPYVVYEF
jgi:hypothetical protein